jgi:hypothetical protein
LVSHQHRAVVCGGMMKSTTPHIVLPSLCFCLAAGEDILAQFACHSSVHNCWYDCIFTATLGQLGRHPIPPEWD